MLIAHLVKVKKSSKSLAQKWIFFLARQMMNFLSVQLLLEILMVSVQIGGKTALLIQLVGLGLASLTSSAGYKEIIDKPSHVINDSMSCIDLIFCTNQNVISDYSIDASIFDRFHHNIIYGKIDILVPLLPKFVCEV